MGAAMTQAMRGFAAWASGRSYRLILLAILFVELIAPVAGGLLVLEALRRGPGAATTAGLLTLLGVAIVSLIGSTSIWSSLGLSAPVIVGGLAAGALLQASRSLSLSFQATVLGGLAVTLGLFVFVPGLDALGAYMQESLLLMFEANGGMEQWITIFSEAPPIMFVQILLMVFLISILAGLMLGYWWYSLIAEPVDFGRDFRALRLGRFAGSVLMLLVAAPLLIDSDWVQSLAQLAVIGFLFQGLAVMHARSRSDNWHSSIVVLVYLALFIVSPLSVLVFGGLSIVGLVDNFFALRARVGPEA
jgi:hypothetical protein